ncbi:MAG: hypothetical protein MRJ67_02275 [Nitrospirales bacterium]|nr:hypothetical protein [Nitrospirales bacterium]
MARPLASLAIDFVTTFTPQRIGRLLMEHLEGPHATTNFSPNTRIGSVAAFIYIIDPIRIQVHSDDGIDSWG